METAFTLSDEVLIGLSTDEFASKRRKHVRPYEERKKGLNRFLSSKHWEAHIVPLTDPMGPATTDRELDAIVVSEETRPMAEKINEVRLSEGLNSLVVIIIPIQYDAQGNKISSSLLKKSVEK